MTDGIVERLRRQARRVVELYGDPEPPEYDMNPADLLWFTVQDAADEIERLRAENNELFARLHGSRGEVDRLRAEVNQLGAELADTSHALGRLRVENECLRAEQADIIDKAYRAGYDAGRAATHGA